MKKQEKIDLIKSTIGQAQIVRFYFKYDQYYHYYYPNAVNEKFILGQEEYDFQLDGYHIRKISDIRKVEVKDNLCGKINVWNGVANCVSNPEIDISSWYNIFSSELLRNRFIIVEDENNGLFAIGFIKKVCRHHVCFESFDADGKWDDSPLIIPYSSITHVAWNTRYTDNWFNYLVQHGQSIKWEE